MSIPTTRAGRADRSVRIRAVVCDLDGTLIDTERVFAEAARRLLARRGQQLEEEFMAAIQGTPGRDALPRFRDRYRLSEPLDALAAEYKRHFFEILDGRPPPLMPGAAALLDRLDERGVPRAIATSSRREYVETVLAPHGVLHRFDFVLTADDVVRGKPHPDVFLKAAERFGVPAAEVAVIEDSAAGCRAARAAGTCCIIIPHAHTPLDQIADADALFPSLDDPALWLWLGVG